MAVMPSYSRSVSQGSVARARPSAKKRAPSASVRHSVLRECIPTSAPLRESVCLQETQAHQTFGRRHDGILVGARRPAEEPTRLLVRALLHFAELGHYLL